MIPTPVPGTVVEVAAPAKVNLALRILGRLPDGFHELETLFQAVDFCDRLRLEVVPEAGAFELQVEGADVGPVEENLVTRAVRDFRRESGVDFGLRIRLEKTIPAGAGLGGGSSDAGAALRAVNLLAGLPLSSGELTALGAGLGADVGFFAQPAGLALGQGRGERLRALAPLPERTLVLGCPPAHVATGPAYGALARSRDAAGDALPPRILAGEPPASWEAVAGVALNDFTPVVANTDPAIARALAALASEGAEMPLLSGSGAAVFGVVPGGVDPEELLRRLAVRDPGTRWVQATTLDHLPSPERLESPRGID